MPIGRRSGKDLRASPWPTAVAISFLQKLLILALQLIVQKDAVNVRAFVAQTLGLLQVRSIDLGVVRQLARLVDAMVEGLAFVWIHVPAPGLEQVPPFLGERDGTRVAIERNGVDESRLPEMPQLTMAWVEGLIELVAEVGRGNDAEGADRGQRPCF